MHLSELKIWNFRKYGEDSNGDEILPGLSLQFNKGINLLVGENDSGKTAIVDAIKYTILTQSYEFIRLEQDDFHLPDGQDESHRTTELRIECTFRGINSNEAKNFLEWLGIEDIGEEFQYFLKVFLVANRKGRNIYYDIKAGADEQGKLLSGEARNLLRSIYLTPLRDAEKELAPRRNSRLSQILDSHESFKEKESDHYLFEVMQNANHKIRKYFEGLDVDETPLDDLQGEELLNEINKYLQRFSGVKNKLNSNFVISDMKLKSILEKLSLNLLTTKAGLGSHNLLFIAVELLLLKREEYFGLKLALIEEIEAHIHTQAQVRLIEFLQDEAATSDIQLILTTHSPVLASKVNLDNLIICKNNNAFPMGAAHTELEKGDYLFLERFLDSTKANLFFAEGVILVEGDAENLLLPTIASIIDKPLAKYGVSLVNVGNTAFLRYSRIFKRKEQSTGLLNIPVSCITDNDIKPDIYKSVAQSKATTKSDMEMIKPIKQWRKEKEERIEGQHVQMFISPHWTLEYDLALGCLQEELFKAVLYAEKVQNSEQYGLTDEKAKKVEKVIEEQYKEWEKQGASNEQRAFYIYHTLMLEKKISKAITAQCLSGILLGIDKEEIQSRILSDSKLEYLVKAISYVTDGKDKND